MLNLYASKVQMKDKKELLEEIDIDELTPTDQITLSPEELIHLLSEAQTELIQEIHTSNQFSGPVPPPDYMRAYKTIDKTLPHRFTKMAEKQQDHSNFIEKSKTYSNIFMAFLGWLTPSSISLYTLYMAGNLIQNDKSIEALVALITALSTIGGAFYLKNKKP